MINSSYKKVNQQKFTPKGDNSQIDSKYPAEEDREVMEILKDNAISENKIETENNHFEIPIPVQFNIISDTKEKKIRTGTTSPFKGRDKNRVMKPELEFLWKNITVTAKKPTKFFKKRNEN